MHVLESIPEYLWFSLEQIRERHVVKCGALSRLGGELPLLIF
jgi:hypothetical protein